MGYTTLPLLEEHHADLLKLWAANMSDARIASVLDRRYQWLYHENPEGGADTRVAIDQEAGSVVGCGSLVPRRMFINGVELMAGVSADFAVARAHRVGGAAIGIMRAFVGDGRSACSFFLGFPNKSSEAILRRVGYRTIASAHAWVKPLSTAYKLRPYFGSLELARLLSKPIDVALGANDWRHLRGGYGTGFEILDRADDRFDQLWHRAKSSYVVTGERTSAYLNWRYGSFTTVPHRFFCLTKSSDLLGYVAFSTQGDKVFVADIFSLDMEKTVDWLLLRFARAMRRERRQSIFVGYAGNPSFSKRLERIGFHPRGDLARKLLAFFKTTTTEQERTLLNPDNWYMFDGEMDI